MSEAASQKDNSQIHPSMPSCIDCQDEHYILQGCCSGRDCGCMGQPVSMTNCTQCNPQGDKPIGEYVASWGDYIEYIFVAV